MIFFFTFVYVLAIAESANEFLGSLGDVDRNKEFVGQSLLQNRPSILTTIQNLQSRNALRSRAAKLDPFFSSLTIQSPTLQRSLLDSSSDHMDLELQNLLFRSRLDDLQMRLAGVPNIINQNTFAGAQPVQLTPVAQTMPNVPSALDNLNFGFSKPSGSSLIDGFLPNMNNPVQVPVDLVGDVHEDLLGDENTNNDNDFNDKVHDANLEMLQSDLNEQPFDVSTLFSRMRDSFLPADDTFVDFGEAIPTDNQGNGFSLRRTSDDGSSDFADPSPSAQEHEQLLEWSLHNFNHANFPQSPPLFKTAEESADSDLVVPSFQPLPASTREALPEEEAPHDWLQHFSEQMRIPKPTFVVAAPVWQRSDDEDTSSHIHLSDIPHFSPLLPNQGISDSNDEAVPEFVALPEEERKFFRYSLPAEVLQMQNAHMGRSLEGPADPQFTDGKKQIKTGAEVEQRPTETKNFQTEAPEESSRLGIARAPFFNTDISIHKTWVHEPWELDLLKPKPKPKPLFPSSGWGVPHFPSASTSSASSASSSHTPHAFATSSGSSSSSKTPPAPQLRPLSSLTFNTQDNHIFNNEASHSQQNIQISNAQGNSGSISQSQSTANEFFDRSFKNGRSNNVLGISPSHLFAMPFWRFTSTNEIPIANEEHNRKRREINLDALKTNNLGASPLPLLSLFVDPNVKLDVPKTLENLGTVARNSFEDPNGPLYHVRNTLSSVRNVMLSALQIPHHDFIIPTKYKIVEHVPDGILGDINPSLFDSAQGPPIARNNLPPIPEIPRNSFEGIAPFLNTYLKLGSMLRESIKSAMDSLSHVGEVYNSAKKSVHTTLQSAPRILKYTHVPVVKHQSPLLDGPQLENKVMLIGPKLLSTSGDFNHDPANIHDDFVGVGRIINALGVSNPDTKKSGYHKVVYKEKIPLSQHGIHKNPKVELQPRPKIVLLPEPDHYKNKAALKEDMIASTLQTLENARATVGATSLEEFFSKMKEEWSALVGEDLTKSITDNVQKLGVINNKLEEKLDKLEVPQSLHNSIDKIASKAKESFDTLTSKHDILKSIPNMTPAEKLKIIADENMQKFNELQRTIKDRLESMKLEHKRSVDIDDYYRSSMGTNNLDPIKEVNLNDFPTLSKIPKQMFPFRISIPLGRRVDENEDNKIDGLELTPSNGGPKAVVKRQDRFNDGTEIVGTGLGLPESLVKPYMGLVTEDEIEQMDEMESEEDPLGKHPEKVGSVATQRQSENPDKGPHPHFTRAQWIALENEKKIFEGKMNDFKAKYGNRENLTNSEKKEEVNQMLDITFGTLAHLMNISNVTRGQGEEFNFNFNREPTAQSSNHHLSNARQAEGEEPDNNFNANIHPEHQFSLINPMQSQHGWQQRQMQMDQGPRRESDKAQNNNFNPQFNPNTDPNFQQQQIDFHAQQRQGFPSIPPDQNARPQGEIPQQFQQQFQEPQVNPNSNMFPVIHQEPIPARPEGHESFNAPLPQNFDPHNSPNFHPQNFQHFDSQNIDPNVHPTFQHHSAQFEEHLPKKPVEHHMHREEKQPQHEKNFDSPENDHVNPHQNQKEDSPNEDPKPHPHPHAHSAFHIPGIHLPHIPHNRHPSGTSSENTTHHAHHSGLARADAIDPFHLLPPIEMPDLFAPVHSHRASESSATHHKKKTPSILPFEWPQIPALPPLPDTDPDGRQSGGLEPQNLFPIIPDLRDMMPMIPTPETAHIEDLFRQMASAPLLPLNLDPFRHHHRSRQHSPSGRESPHHPSTNQHPSQEEGNMQHHSSNAQIDSNADDNFEELDPSNAPINNRNLHPKFRRP